MRTYITALILAATLALVSCGGGNDVASSGASAVSAAAPSTPTTEAKVNGQVDERTGVAPVVARMHIAKSCSDYEGFNVCGCGYFGNFFGRRGDACRSAINNATAQNCNALGATWVQPDNYLTACSSGPAANAEQCTALWGGSWQPGRAYCSANNQSFP